MGTYQKDKYEQCEHVIQLSSYGGMSMSKWEKNHQFLMDQVQYMKDIKWFEGERIGHDPSDDRFLERWCAEGGAKWFREKWEEKYGPIEDGCENDDIFKNRTSIL